MQALKHELKKLIPLTVFFFLSFAYILLIVDLFLKDYNVDGLALTKALLGAVIAAKTVAILDAVLKSDRFREFPRYVSVLYRTFLYTFVAMIIASIEGLFEAYRKTRALPAAIVEFLHTETFYHLLAVTLCIAVVFFLHNLWREIDSYLGKGTLGKFFLSRPRTYSDRLG